MKSKLMALFLAASFLFLGLAHAASNMALSQESTYSHAQDDSVSAWQSDPDMGPNAWWTPIYEYLKAQLKKYIWPILVEIVTEIYKKGREAIEYIKSKFSEEDLQDFCACYYDYMGEYGYAGIGGKWLIRNKPGIGINDYDDEDLPELDDEDLDVIDELCHEFAH